MRASLPMSKAISLMGKAMQEASNGNSVMPLRWGMYMPSGGVMGMMPGYIAGPECFGLKVINMMPQNNGTKRSSHIGLMMLFEPKHGVPLALIDGGEITAMRTAAASAMATQHLARKDSRVLTILGSGEQARSHIEAMMLVRDFDEYRVWSRNSKNVEMFCEDMALRHGIEINSYDDVRSAVKGTDVICAVTGTKEPILFGEDLEPGMHLNVVGASEVHKREIDTDAVKKSSYFIDSRKSTMNQAGELLQAIKEGVVSEDHIRGEIGTVITGEIKGRTSKNEITLYRSLGVVTQDLVVAYYLYEQALKKGGGTKVDF